MTPQELRIGNYVRPRDTGETVRVCGVTEKHVRLRVTDPHGKEYDMTYEYSEIDGVPIRDVYSKLPSISALTWDDRTEDIYCYGHGSATYDYICIKHLHELQNIHYALTGKEIEIEI